MMTPEKARDDMRRDQAREMLRLIRHNAEQANALLDNDIGPTEEKFLLNHAGFILHQAEKFAEWCAQ